MELCEYISSRLSKEIEKAVVLEALQCEADSLVRPRRGLDY